MFSLFFFLFIISFFCYLNLFVKHLCVKSLKIAACYLHKYSSGPSYELDWMRGPWSTAQGPIMKRCLIWKTKIGNVIRDWHLCICCKWEIINWEYFIEINNFKWLRTHHWKVIWRDYFIDLFIIEFGPLNWTMRYASMNQSFQNQSFSRFNKIFNYV